MLMNIAQWDENGHHIDRTTDHLLFALLQLGFNTAVFYVYFRKLYPSFLRMCSLSIILADVMMVILLAAVMSLNDEQSHRSLCSLFAYFSATHAALPLPMMCLGLLDYCLEDTRIGKHSICCKSLRNAVLTLLLWTLSAIYAFGSVTAELLELHYVNGIETLACRVEESSVITYFVVALFTAVMCTMLPFWSEIPQWVKEDERLFDAMEASQEYQKSDFRRTSATYIQTEDGEESFLEETTMLRRPLWVSLTLSFGLEWMPYLTVCVTLLLFGRGRPAYITVNLLWMQCAKSLLVRVMLWISSKTKLPKAVCDPSKEEQNTLHV